MTFHTPDPPRPPGRGTGLERSGRQARDRTDRQRRKPPEDADADPEAGVIQILHELDMPPDDARALVEADDPVILRRYVELHGERLAERLADQRRTLVDLERTLSRAILDRRSAC